MRLIAIGAQYFPRAPIAAYAPAIVSAPASWTSAWEFEDVIVEAACLRVEPGTEIVVRRKMMTANDVPVRIATSHFRADLFGDTRLAEPEFVQPSLQSALVALGYAFGHAEENLTARPPTAFEREALELEPGEWIVQVLRASHSTEDTPIHVLETICAANRHIFSIGQVTGNDEF
jgi:DNA-binding GntR family transcriptional regulator